eukprot:TRINITY_DN112467_c0_g1_i1.p1 TRINITY_DN112467_c0_g1~~TRINITY_DN112467_c0_g1_i1.p1  ORF type:complete len:624 (+),score=122.69 TRINITY_DN112467_c0_g1_i1:74-1945(+)
MAFMVSAPAAELPSATGGPGAVTGSVANARPALAPGLSTFAVLPVQTRVRCSSSDSAKGSSAGSAGGHGMGGSVAMASAAAAALASAALRRLPGRTGLFHGGGSSSSSTSRPRQTKVVWCGTSLSSMVERRRDRVNVAAKGGRKQQLATQLPDGMDFYGCLGIEKGASQDEIRAAYKKVIKETHPDVNQDPTATDRFMQAQEAFRWLSDPQQREVYDSVGEKFGQDALYDYTDEVILGSLNTIKGIAPLMRAVDLVQWCRKLLYVKQVIKIDQDVQDIRNRFRKYGAMRVQFVKNVICSEIRRVLQYPRVIRRMHPFERISVELTLNNLMNKGHAPFGKLLGALKEFRLHIHEEAATRAHAASKAERGRLATFIADQGIEDMFEMLLEQAPIFEQFRAAQLTINRQPSLNLDKPTIAFVGAPNVGKSSLVLSLSSGKPEVNVYAYTTRDLTIGHIWHFIAGTPLLIHGQVLDTPGLRHKPDSKDQGNLMDQLTLAAMKHLPSGVVYTFDPFPDTSGLLSVDEQIELRNALRAKFPKRPWLDVITKVDLELAQGGIERLLEFFPDAILVSSLDGTGLEELNIEVRRLLEEMTKVVRQLQRAKMRQLRVADNYYEYIGKEAIVLR